MKGLYHVSGESISSFDLLEIIKSVYGMDIGLEPNSTFVIDRSLDSSRFRQAMGYQPPSWDLLVRDVYEFK